MNMKVGEIGYSTSSCFNILMDGYLYMLKDSTYIETREELLKFWKSSHIIKLKKINKNKNGFEIDLNYFYNKLIEEKNIFKKNNDFYEDNIPKILIQSYILRTDYIKKNNYIKLFNIFDKFKE